MRYIIKIIILLLIININLYSKSPVRIKDIVIIEGIRDNQLMGFGIVTGLQGTGDSKSFKMTKTMLKNLAQNYGFDITEDDLNGKNLAAVLVTANAGPFSRSGDRIDISISSIGDSKSIEGGVLLMTPLKGPDNIVYAVAQGKIIAGNKIKNTLNTATLPDGAIMEKNIISTFLIDNKIRLIVKNPDFVTANQIREQILSINPDLKLSVTDPGLIEIILGTEEMKNPVDFIAKLEILTVTPDFISMVVIDKKTGIIVVGEDIIIQECSITTPFAQLNIKSSRKNNVQLSSQTVGDLVKNLNETGLNTDEIISMLEAIHKIGAINAKLIIL